MEKKFDAEILSSVGLSDEEATDFITKHQAYLHSLTPAQYEMVKHTLPTWEQAAKAIDPHMTAADLQDFVARRGRKPEQFSAFCFGFTRRHKPHQA